MRPAVTIIAKILSQQIIPSLLQTLQGGLNESGGRIGNVDSTVSGLLGRGYDLSGGISGQVFNPIMDEISTPLSNWAAQGVTDFGNKLSTSISYGVPITEIRPVNPNIGTNTLNNGVKLTPEATSLLGDSGDLDLSQIDTSLANTGTNVGSAVTNKAGSIANNSVFSK